MSRFYLKENQYTCSGKSIRQPPPPIPPSTRTFNPADNEQVSFYCWQIVRSEFRSQRIKEKRGRVPANEISTFVCSFLPPTAIGWHSNV